MSNVSGLSNIPEHEINSHDYTYRKSFESHLSDILTISIESVQQINWIDRFSEIELGIYVLIVESDLVKDTRYLSVTDERTGENIHYISVENTNDVSFLEMMGIPLFAL